MKWVTREKARVDRIACPWLITRFIDAEAEFMFVHAEKVSRIARQTGSIPFDIEGVELSHDGPLCSFDAFLRKYNLEGDSALRQLAAIVRGADTARLDLAPQCAGVFAISLGLSRMFSDDHELLRYGMIMYDALYTWLTEAKEETHTHPERMISAA